MINIQDAKLSEGPRMKMHKFKKSARWSVQYWQPSSSSCWPKLTTWRRAAALFQGKWTWVCCQLGGAPGGGPGGSGLPAAGSDGSEAELLSAAQPGAEPPCHGASGPPAAHPLHLAQGHGEATPSSHKHTHTHLPKAPMDIGMTSLLLLWGVMLLTETPCTTGSFWAALPPGATDSDQQAGEPTGGDPTGEARPVQPGATPVGGCGGL